MKKLIKKTLDRFRFPYICSHEGLIKGKTLRFHVNNHVEKFRLKNFGGERDQIAELLSLLRSEDVFYDIGSSVGAWSIPAALKLTKGWVVSFEPDPENQDRLLKNYELNGLSNYEIQPVALGDRQGCMELFTAGSNAASPSLRPVNKISNSIQVRIEVIDDLIQRRLIPPPNVVKIDVEGAEMMVLKGMTRLLSGERKPRRIKLELHPLFLPSFQSNVTEVFKFLLNKGYAIEELISREDQIICTFEYGGSSLNKADNSLTTEPLLHA